MVAENELKIKYFIFYSPLLLTPFSSSFSLFSSIPCLPMFQVTLLIPDSRMNTLEQFSTVRRNVHDYNQRMSGEPRPVSGIDPQRRSEMVK